MLDKAENIPGIQALLETLEVTNMQSLRCLRVKKYFTNTAKKPSYEVTVLTVMGYVPYTICILIYRIFNASYLAPSYFKSIFMECFAKGVLQGF